MRRSTLTCTQTHTIPLNDFHLSLFQFTGTIYDSGDMPCECVYIGFNVIRSVFSGGASGYLDVVANRTKCNDVSTPFLCKWLFVRFFRWSFQIFNQDNEKYSIFHQYSSPKIYFCCGKIIFSTTKSFNGTIFMKQLCLFCAKYHLNC